MSIREHLKTFHEKSALFHQSLAKSHAEMARHFKKLAASADGEASEAGEQIAATHADLSKAHLDHGAFHKTSMEQCEKAVAADDLAKSQIVPDGVRGTIPTNVPNVTAVPRTGQPELQVNMRDVPAEFAFLKVES